MFEIDFYNHSEDSIIRQAKDRLLRVNDDWEKQIWQFVINWFDSSITTISVFTSGSTGLPKQLAHSKSSMLYSANMTCTALNLKHGDKALLCLPVNKISGMMMVVRSIHNKMKLLCIRPSANPLAQLPDKPGINFAAFTPMQFHDITGNYSSFQKADSIGKIILGGEDVRAELQAGIQKLKNEVYITFGMTETISHIALKKLNGTVADKNFKVLPGIIISVDDRNCLVINALNLGQPHLVTNDVISLESENEFKWLGRIDNVINSGGVKIYPEEIEQQLTNIIETPFFIASIPDERMGEKLVLVLEKRSLKPGEKDDLLLALAMLEKLHRPKEILLTEHFKRTANGKIKRKETMSNQVQVITFTLQ